MNVDVQADIKAATQSLYRFEKRVLPRAINSSLNKTARNVRAQSHREISKKTGLTIKEIKPHSWVLKSTFLTLTAAVYMRRKTVNLIRFVMPSKRNVGAFAKRKGVSANPWRSRRRVHEGAFIMRLGGNPFVVKRISKNSNKVKALYGPALHVEFDRPTMRIVLSAFARARFRINFIRDLKYYISRAG